MSFSEQENIATVILFVPAERVFPLSTFNFPRVFILLVSAQSSRRIGESNSCPPDLELGALTKWQASRMLVRVSQQASLQALVLSIELSKIRKESCFLWGCFGFPDNIIDTGM